MSTLTVGHPRGVRAPWTLMVVGATAVVVGSTMVLIGAWGGEF